MITTSTNLKELLSITEQLSRAITTHSFKIERTQNKAGMSSTILLSKNLIPPRFLKKLLEVMIPT